MTVRALLSTARGFANAVNRQAVKNKKFAQELVFNHGIRGEITPKSLQGITKDMFDSAGRMTQKGKAEIQRVISETGLSKNATWDQILEAIGKRKEQVAKDIECTFVKLKDVANNVKKFDIEKFKEALKDGIKKFVPADPKYANELTKVDEKLATRLGQYTKGDLAELAQKFKSTPIKS